MKRNQLIVFFTLLIVFAVCAFLTYALFMDQLTALAGTPMPEMGMSNTVIGLANAGLILVFYGLFGLAGYWFARKLELPGIFSENGSWHQWILTPLILGTVCGFIFIVGDLIFAPINGLGRFTHPGFPLSILASLSAGIGEEIIFRGFVFGLWGWLLNLALRRFNRRNLALWIANIIAALAFGAAHLGTVMALAHASTPADLQPTLLFELFLLNGIVGLVAGDQYRKSGLIAAVGVHFWTDIFWHVLWGLFS